MASPNSSFTEIVTTTLQGYSKTLADNVTNHNALMRHMDDKGNKQPATGRTIVQELEYAVNSTSKWYSGYEALDTSPSDVFTAAEFSYKQLAGNVVISGLEEVQNSGREAIHNLLKSRIKNLEKSLKNTFATAMYADGTGTDGKEIGGLQLLVSDAGAGTVGGIVSGTYTWWKNQIYDFSGESVTASATTIQAAMNALWLKCIRGADKPDVVTADTTYFNYYWSSLQTNQRFSSDRKAAAGFMNLLFMDAPVFYDDQAPTTHMYMLNTDYLFMRPSAGREFVALGEKASVNQDAMVMPMVWAGNMTVSNRSVQGVIVA
jgi:hypothetical protein